MNGGAVSCGVKVFYTLENSFVNSKVYNFAGAFDEQSFLNTHVCEFDGTFNDK